MLLQFVGKGHETDMSLLELIAQDPLEREFLRSLGRSLPKKENEKKGDVVEFAWNGERLSLMML